ncbi:HNH endonuclease family protein [Corynebacterium kalidii]|uniref:HNH endonuclease family protein n=1 Tax=Corynebacterium kalidii TaxID=2931982 RepID=A0A9X2B2P6_9CORY|nr:HNH endonuclease family protein [Corynebacterium kalidii]
MPLAALLSLALLALWLVAGVHGRDSARTAPRADDRATVVQALDELTTVARRTHVLGYSRDHFGGWAQQWWTGPADSADSGPAPAGSRCSTRQVVMLAAFPDRSPTADGSCPASRGDTVDVYTGDTITPADVEIDHVVPLSAAWDHGAWSWPRAERVRFANDTELNLVAVAGRVNQDKSDGSLGEWLPPTAKAGSPSEAGCAYAARYLAVCLRYGLTVSDGDASAARQVCAV